jgi:demethylmenaquinone methyltransferase/2-methoxy-6-polyprenyl-1,4-benzoquinol methylase
MNQDLTTYYRDRAKEYDKIYAVPEEQADLAIATTLFQKLFSGKTVLEIACGTGWWTEHISKVAKSIVATDINESVLEVARLKKHADNVAFKIADIYSMTADKKYDALFGGFIWSHILIQDLDDLLLRIKNCLDPGALVIFIDNKLVGRHPPGRITRTDGNGNTWQIRALDNGTLHEVLKNFPSKEFLHEKLSRFASDVEYVDLEYYWILICKLKK